MLTPEPIINLATGYWQSRAFLAAVDLKLFDALGSDGQPIDELSKLTNVPEEKLTILVGALKELKLLDICKDTRDIIPTEITSMFLNPDSPAYMGDSLSYAREMFPLWHQLEERLQSTNAMPLTPSKKDTPSFLASMHERANMIIPLVTPLLNISAEDRVLDIAAGAGTWSLVLQNNFGTKQMTLLEQPELLPDMQTFITEKGLNAEEFIAADYHDWQSEKRWSKILYFGALHQESESESHLLLNKFCQWLEPGGTLYILDIFSADREDNNLFAYLFGLNMTLTTAGAIHHLDRAEETLKGFSGIESVKHSRLAGNMPYYLIEVNKAN